MWEKALIALDKMRSAALEPNIVTYSTLISALEKSGQWERALKIWEDMHKDGVHPNAAMFNTMITALGKNR